MNVLEVIASAKPKTITKEFKGVDFSFRALRFDEFARIGQFSQAEVEGEVKERDFKKLAAIVNESLSINPLVSWSKMTPHFLEDCGLDLPMAMTDEEKAEEIPFQENYKILIIEKLASASTEFATFFCNSAFEATNEIREQKKT